MVRLNEPQGNVGVGRCCVGPGLGPQITTSRYNLEVGDPNLHLRTLASIHLLYLSTDLLFHRVASFYRNLAHIFILKRKPGSHLFVCPFASSCFPVLIFFTEVLITHTIPILLLHFFYIPVPTRPPKHKTLS